MQSNAKAMHWLQLTCSDVVMVPIYFIACCQRLVVVDFILSIWNSHYCKMKSLSSAADVDVEAFVKFETFGSPVTCLVLTKHPFSSSMLRFARSPFF